MGSTAEHCFRLSGESTWSNGGTVVGSRYYYDVETDAILLRSSGGSNRFNANMYYGGTYAAPNTSH